jgi:hypothetical protein
MCNMCVYVFVCVCGCARARTFAGTHVPVYSTYLCVSLGRYRRMYLCVYVCMYVCTCVCIT